MKNYLQKKKISHEQFPQFPPKKLFNKSKNFIQKRIAQINTYFQKIFDEYKDKVPYTNAIIDLCQPFKLNVAVIGQKGSGKSKLIKGMVDVLVDF